MKAIILAGGSGTRLWPLSRNNYPKQFIKFADMTYSLFQETYLRCLHLMQPEDIYVVTNEKYKFLVKGEIEELGYRILDTQLLIEPSAKNTLPAITYGVFEINKHGQHDILVLPSDHKIDKITEFVELVNQSSMLAKEKLITFGINPTHPNTGYGYISYSNEILNGFAIEEFKEKPNRTLAEEYIHKGYLWNAGIFFFNSIVYFNELKLHNLELYDLFVTNLSIEEKFNKISNPTSIDYGLLEKSKNVATVKSDIGWNDLGSFDSIQEVLSHRDQNGNIKTKESILVDTSNTMILSDHHKLITTIGLDDMIIIDNRDALLVCKKNESEKVKELVQTLKLSNDPRVDFHVQDYRPWGKYRIIEEEKNEFKIKRIFVEPGKKLSYQMHHHRSEHWVVVRGMATVIIDGIEKEVHQGESIFIRNEQKHRLINNQETVLEIIEVQLGEYLEEDDIIRFDDDYSRK